MWSLFRTSISRGGRSLTNEAKKMWRCANDFMGYCSGEPEWGVPPREASHRSGAIYGDVEGTCKRDPKTCGKYLTYSQMLEARLRKGAGVRRDG